MKNGRAVIVKKIIEHEWEGMNIWMRDWNKKQEWEEERDVQEEGTKNGLKGRKKEHTYIFFHVKLSYESNFTPFEFNPFIAKLNWFHSTLCARVNQNFSPECRIIALSDLVTIPFRTKTITYDSDVNSVQFI